MISSDVVEIIKYHISQKMIVKIERNNIDEIMIGFPVELSNEFLLMNIINDFHDEGFAIIKVNDITDAYSNESDIFL